METITEVTDREVKFTRTFNAKVNLVWDAWTKAENLAQWWGPDGFSLTTIEFDLSPGGIWRFTMHGPDRDFPNKIIFTEVRPHTLLSYHQSDDDGPEGIYFDAELLFTDLGEKTKLVMKMTFEKPEILKYVSENYGAIEGGQQHIKRLAGFVELYMVN